MYKLVRRVIQYFSFPNRPIKGGDIFGFLERGGILEKGGGMIPLTNYGTCISLHIGNCIKFESINYIA